LLCASAGAAASVPNTVTSNKTVRRDGAGMVGPFKGSELLPLCVKP